MDALRSRRREQLELRLTLGAGRDLPETFVFSEPDGQMLSPDKLSRDWRRVVASKKLLGIMFHSLRHSHASALIAAGQDVVKASRRLGHGSTAVTLTVYGHLFEKTDTGAADAIEAVLRR